MSGSLNWPEQLPRCGKLVVDFLTEKVIADIHTPISELQFRRLYDPILAPDSESTDMFRAAFCQVCAPALQVQVA